MLIMSFVLGFIGVMFNSNIVCSGMVISIVLFASVLFSFPAYAAVMLYVPGAKFSGIWANPFESVVEGRLVSSGSVSVISAWGPALSCSSVRFTVIICLFSVKLSFMSCFCVVNCRVVLLAL